MTRTIHETRFLRQLESDKEAALEENENEQSPPKSGGQNSGYGILPFFEAGDDNAGSETTSLILD